MVTIKVNGKEEGLVMSSGQRPRSGRTEFLGSDGTWKSIPQLPKELSSAQMAWNPDTQEHSRITRVSSPAAVSL